MHRHVPSAPASRETDSLRDEHDRLRLTIDILRAVIRCTHEGEILQVVATKLGDALGADRAAVMLLGEGRDDLRIVASAEDPGLREMAVDLRRYPEIRRSLEGGETVFVEDAKNDPTFADLRPLIERLDIRQVAVVPIRWEGLVLGTLFLRTRGIERFARTKEPRLHHLPAHPRPGDPHTGLRPVLRGGRRPRRGGALPRVPPRADRARGAVPPPRRPLAQAHRRARPRPACPGGRVGPPAHRPRRAGAHGDRRADPRGVNPRR